MVDQAVRNEALTILRNSLATVESEYSSLKLEVRGKLPEGLDGVLYRNGPGRMQRGGYEYGHLFDGDGHVCRFEFADGTVRYTNRFVRTRFFREEEQAGRVLYRSLRTNRPGGLRANFLNLRFKNAANTNVISFGERLLALCEGGAPYALDPASLTTEGTWDMEGALRNPFDAFSRFLSPLLPFTAHPSVDPVTGELIGFGVLPGRPNRLLTYRINREGQCIERRHFELGGTAFVHDALVTEHWMLFLLPRADFDMTAVLFGHTSAARSMNLCTDRPMEIMLVPRAGGEPVTFETFPGFVFHFAGGGEHPDGSLHANLVHHAELPALSNVDELLTCGKALGRLTRLEIDPTNRRSKAVQLSEHAHELPRLGLDAQRIYSSGVPANRDLPFYSAILSSELSSDGRTARTLLRDFYPDLPGEPVAAEAGSETWLLVLVYRAREHRTDLVILRAEDLTTVAEVPLPHSLPPGFHGSWVAAPERSGG